VGRCAVTFKFMVSVPKKVGQIVEKESLVRKGGQS